MKEKGATEGEMVVWHGWLNGPEFEQTPGDSKRQGRLACCSPWGQKESDMTEQLNNNNDVAFGLPQWLSWQRICLPMRKVQETRVRSLGQEDPLEKEMVTQSSILSRRIPWTQDPGSLQSIGPQRVGHDWSDLACMHVAFMYDNVLDTFYASSHLIFTRALLCGHHYWSLFLRWRK